MTVEIPTDLQAFVEQAVQRGEYSSEGDVICNALRMLQERDRRREELTAEIQKGIDQLDRGKFTDADVLFDRLERRAQHLVRSSMPNGAATQ